MSRDFLSAIWGDDFPYGELRCMHNGEVRQEWFAPEQVDDLIATAMEWDNAGWDSYIGAIPRVRPGGKAEDCTPTTSVLFADVDAKHLDGRKMSALLALGRSSITPSIVVDSGNGMHAWWLLQHPVQFDLAAQVMKGLASAIGGDAVYDAPRVLRLPGTHNHKSNPPKPVRLLHFEPQRRYRFSDFDNYLPVPSVPRDTHRPSTPRNYDLLPDWLRELIEEPTPKGYRSGAIFKAMMWLIRYGWGKEDIDYLLSDHPDGFGEKLLEMRPKQADRWVERTFDRALQAATEEKVA